ncbi:MAG: MarR family transcriptional regulator [Rhodospirillales bacterium]
MAGETPLQAVYRMPGHLMRRMQQIAVSVFHDCVAPSGLDVTPVQYALLKAAQSCPGLDQASLAGAIAYDRTTIGGVIDRLEQKGLLKREVSPLDRRARIVHLTDIGHDTIAGLDPLVEQAQRDMLSGLTPEEAATLTGLLAKAVSTANSASRAPLRHPVRKG